MEDEVQLSKDDKEILFAILQMVSYTFQANRAMLSILVNIGTKQNNPVATEDMMFDNNINAFNTVDIQYDALMQKLSERYGFTK